MQISDFSLGDISQDDVIHINEAGLDRKVTVADLATHVEGELAHDSITGSGANTHAQVDTHLADATKHRVINDAGSSTTDLWSADKVITYSSAQTHDASSVTSGTFADARISESSVTQHEAAIDHDALSGFVDKEHIDWTADAGADNINDANVLASSITQHEASVSHDALADFVADEHIAHSAVVLTAGTGLSGGGDTTVSRSFDFDASLLTPIATPVAADVIPLYDDGVGQRSVTFANLEANLDHDNLTNYDSNEHVDHSAVTLTAGEGLSGGGTIGANRTFDVDITSLTEDLTPDETTDFVMSYDDSAGSLKKVKMDNLVVTETILVNNDGVNLGVGGIDVFKGMNGTDLEFRSINNASSKLSVALDAGNEEVDLDIVEGNIDINDFLNASTMLQHTGDVTSNASGVTSITAEAVDTPELADDAVTLDKLDSAASVVGKHTLFIPAGAMRPTVSNGCDSLQEIETTAGRPDMQVLDFDTAVDEHSQFQVTFPKAWDEGTVTAQFYWTHDTTTTNFGVAWGIQGVAVSNDDTLDVAYGTAIVTTDTGGTTEDLYHTVESASITIAGTPVADDLCYFRVFRDVSDAGDTMVVDARLLGVKLLFSIDTANDN